MKRAVLALAACIAGFAAEASDVNELYGYTSRFFALQSLAIDSPAGGGKDRLVAPVGWISGRTERGNTWIGSPDERYVVQIAATEGDITGDGSAERRKLLASLRQRYDMDVVVRDEGNATVFEATSDMPGAEPAQVRSLIRIWLQGRFINMLQFHVIVRRGDWGTPEAEDVIQLFRDQLQRASAARPEDVAQREPQAQPGAPTFVPMEELARKLGGLKTVSLDGYRFRAPASWDTGRDDNGVAWAASPSRHYALERKVRVLPAGGDWRAAVKRRAAEIFRDLTGQNISGELASAERLERMLALQIPVERSDHAGFKVWHWPQLLHIDGVIVEAWLSLHVRESLWHSAGTEDLEQLFGQQFTSLPPGDPRQLGSRKTGFGLDRLRPIKAFGFVELNVPARWYDEYTDKGDMWVACEDEPDTGTLWIKYDVYGGDVDDSTVEIFAQPIRARGAVPRPTPFVGRKLLHEVSTDREKGEMLRFNRWILIERRSDEIVVLQFTLVLDLEQEKIPEFAALVTTMEREIAAARLGASP